MKSIPSSPTGLRGEDALESILGTLEDKRRGGLGGIWLHIIIFVNLPIHHLNSTLSLKGPLGDGPSLIPHIYPSLPGRFMSRSLPIF